MLCMFRIIFSKRRNTGKLNGVLQRCSINRPLDCHGGRTQNYRGGDSCRKGLSTATNFATRETAPPPQPRAMIPPCPLSASSNQKTSHSSIVEALPPLLFTSTSTNNRHSCMYVCKQLCCIQGVSLSPPLCLPACPILHPKSNPKPNYF